MNNASMLAHIYDAHHAYAEGRSELKVLPDGRKSITHTTAEWASTDEFDGGNPFIGFIRVCNRADGKAVWDGYYHGWLTDAAPAGPEVFNFMRQAMAQPNPNLIRGPKKYQAGGYTYVNDLEFGDIDCFYGSETIYDAKNQVVYRGRYGGGLVDLSEDEGEIQASM